MAIQIPGYKIIRQIGSGGMATVFLAVQEALDREIALKVMSQQITGQDGSFKERFLREGKSIAQLSHYRIVGVYDMGASDGHYYIAMEYLNGGSLKDKIQAGLTPEQSLEIIKKIAESLGYAHNKGYVHRDVKPMNILFREEGAPVLTDFGIAKIVLDTGSELTSTGLIMGTPSYMSPEQAKGEIADGRSDLYSLGIVFYEMLMGIVPYTADTAIAVLMKHVNDARPELPQYLNKYQFLLDRMLAKDPNDRFQNVEEFIGATGYHDELLDQTIIHNRPGSSSQTSSETTSRHRFTKILVSVLMLGVLGGGGYYLFERSKQQPAIHLTPKSVHEIPPRIFSEDEKQSQQIAILLAEATQIFLSSQALDPNRARAVVLLQEVLHLDANNIIALNTRKKIVDDLLILAEKKRRAANYPSSLQMIRRGLSIDQRHDDMLALQKQVVHAMEGSRRAVAQQLQIQRLLAQVASENQLNPHSENVFLLYREILAIDDNATAAKQGLQQALKQLYRTAQQMKDADKDEESLALVEKGLHFGPTNTALLLLKQELVMRIAQTQHKSVQRSTIKMLLKQANQHMESLELVEPQGKNAYAIYRRILAMEPNNATAKLGIKEVADQLEELANVRISVQDQQSAISLIEEGLKVDPTHSGLLRLKRKYVVNKGINTQNSTIFAPFSQNSKPSTHKNPDIIFSIDR